MLRANKCGVGLLVASGIVLLAASPVTAQTGQPGRAKWFLPWDAPGYQAQSYNEPRQPAPPPPATYYRQSKYTITVTRLPREASEGDPNTVLLMAHLPEDAQIWVQGAASKQKGAIRYFESPPLTAGQDYVYTVRLTWVEDGKWVSQTRQFPVKAGGMQCIDIVKAESDLARQEVEANLAKLGPEDRKLAEAQRFCPIQEGNPLGSMGTPVKIMVKGQPVFLCCDGCVKKAQSNPDQTLNKVRELKAGKSAAPTP